MRPVSKRANVSLDNFARARFGVVDGRQMRRAAFPSRANCGSASGSVLYQRHLALTQLDFANSPWRDSLRIGNDFLSESIEVVAKEGATHTTEFFSGSARAFAITVAHRSHVID